MGAVGDGFENYFREALRYFLWVMDNHLSYEVIE